MKKVIVAGSRNFNNFNLVEDSLMLYFKENSLHRGDVEIISGGAKGADKLGKLFANKYGLKYTEFLADWELYGKSAGPIRNSEMIKYIKNEDSVLFVFWNGYSKGSKDIIDKGIKNKIPVKIVGY